MATNALVEQQTLSEIQSSFGTLRFSDLVVILCSVTWLCNFGALKLSKACTLHCELVGKEGLRSL